MHLHLTIDFVDDIARARAPWTESRLRQLVATMAKRGVQTIRWIGHGGPDSGLWERGSYFDTLGDASATMQRLVNPLAIVCDEAHQHGMRVLDIIKPFDMAFGVPVSSFPVKRGLGTGLSHVGGEGGGAARWLRDHPHMRTKLHPSLLQDASSGPIQTIRLWHETADLPKCGVQIMVSRDNDVYRPYDGPGTFFHEVRKRRSPSYVPAPMQRDAGVGSFTCLEFTGLAIQEAFVCLKPTGDWSIANDLIALLEVEDTAGNPVPFTYGLVPLQPPNQPRASWSGGPIAFDASSGTPVPGGMGPASAGGRVRFTSDHLPFVGFARGRNAYPGGIVDPVYPEVRQWGAELASQSMAAGADGVDLRFGTSTETLDSENYGFSRPLIEAFHEQHKIDLATQPFDRAAWRTLRGSYMTQLVRETRTAVKDHGGEFHVHVHPDMRHPASKSSRYETWWDWRGWLKDGLLDGITGRQCGARTPFAKELLGACQEAGVAATFSQRPAADSREADWLTWMRHAREDGYTALDLDKLASIAYLNEDGELHDTYPQLWPGLSRVTTT